MNGLNPAACPSAIAYTGHLAHPLMLCCPLGLTQINTQFTCIAIMPLRAVNLLSFAHVCTTSVAWLFCRNQHYICCGHRRKDESTTQSSLGFRVCGLLVHNSRTGDCWRADRHWGKTLTPDNVHEAFNKYADNGGYSGCIVVVLWFVRGPCKLISSTSSLACAHMLITPKCC